MRTAAECDWGYEEFGHAELGDDRRRQRLVKIAAGAAARPAGKVLEVFRSSAERQGTYDFLENDDVRSDDVCAAMGKATALRAAEHSFVFAAIDGSSLTLSDKARAKDFGAIGASKSGARGLKVITSYLVSPQGVPLGLAAQEWWARPAAKRARKDHQKRLLNEKETRHWVEAIETSVEVLERDAPQTRLWFQLDREADGGHVLEKLAQSGHWFTVRSSHNRRLVSDGGPRYLLDGLALSPPVGTYELPVTGAPNRTARLARMVLRVTHETLSMRDKATNKRVEIVVCVVQAREEGTTPTGEKPLEWRLLTNYPVKTFEDARLVVFGYAQRWRIEEFHRTWKTGACNVEQCQLRVMRHVVKWATIMAAVAARIERLKMLARTEPELPAACELNDYEIRAVVMMKRKYKKRTETIPDTMPTIAQAVLWLAELGGYTGKSSGGPPGSITIRRGLDFIGPVAITLEMLENEGELR
jgi:hypothetical protein